MKRMFEKIKCFFGFHVWEGVGFAVHYDETRTKYLSFCDNCFKVIGGNHSDGKIKK